MHVLPTQNANIISVFVTGSSYTNAVFKHKPFEECNRTWKIFCEINWRWNCLCALGGGGGGAEERRYTSKIFDFSARVRVSGRVDSTAAGKVPHVHYD